MMSTGELTKLEGALVPASALFFTHGGILGTANRSPSLFPTDDVAANAFTDLVDSTWATLLGR